MDHRPLNHDATVRGAALEVAAAILVRADGAVLLARRAGDRPFAGYWEFPGGKIEPGETPAAALARELREELDIAPERATPWITRLFPYPHAAVRLRFHRVFAWRGDPRPLEHDALAWQQPHSVEVGPLLPANLPVLRALCLPLEYAISDAAELGTETFVERLKTRLEDGLRLVQIREKSLSRGALAALARRVIALARPRGARVLINADADLARAVSADGVHLTAAQLRTLPARPGLALVGASCHSAEELRLAESLPADFAVLGPVRSTPSHPRSEPLGWGRFAELVADAALPVYALGGLEPGDLPTALDCGAHGLAMVRGAWRPPVAGV